MFYLDSSVVKSVLRIGIFVNLILLACYCPASKQLLIKFQT